MEWKIAKNKTGVIYTLNKCAQQFSNLLAIFYFARAIFKTSFTPTNNETRGEWYLLGSSS